jgi:diguanylate cyclase (GGDEF)-like protein
MAAAGETVGASALRRRYVQLGALCLSLSLATLFLAFGPLANTSTIPGSPLELHWALLLAGFCLAEFLSVNVEARDEAHTVNFVELVYVAGLLLATPQGLILARVLSGVLVFGLVRRQAAHKLVTNVALFAGEAAVATAVFTLVLNERSPMDPQGWAAVFAATSAAFLVGAVTVTAAIAIFNGWPSAYMVRQVILIGGVVSLANTSIGLAVVGSIWTDSPLGFLVLSVVGVLYVLYRAYTRVTERHKDLETLHDFTRALGGSLELSEVERAVVHGARTILRAEHAALLLPPIRESLPGTRIVAVDDDVRRANVSPTELAADLTMLLPDGNARLFVPGEPVPAWLAEIGVKDAAIVPVTAEGMPSGALLVANRLTEVSTFLGDDLRVFETLANHASVALENGRLVAHLQHDAADKAYQALHDPVTGLPNRTALTEELAEAIAAARADARSVGLIFIDLDTFKEVNDTLGTVMGDRLLVEVRDRLEKLLPAAASMARFTGDVFAVLLADVRDEAEVVAVAQSLHAAFDLPFSSDTVSLVLGATAGIALYPDHASSADVLLQRADAATYAARLEGSGLEVYSAEIDPYAPRRLALAAELREALDAGEVEVYVQPKVSLADGVVRGAEALVRWNHPRLGAIPPTQFIPAAEHTGVIRPLTLYVLRNALQQCRGWRDAGHDLEIAVNLSARNLFDVNLVEDIGRIIDDVGVPAKVLTLELTESTVMSEGGRSMDVLLGLQDLGVGLSVDDFGTGYSSLAHLRRLPISELKIDQSFVATMTVNEHDAVIVRTLVELGNSLGLQTVAEGVESREAYEMLREFGCDLAQGYLLSRPLPAAQFWPWLQRQEVGSLAPADDVVWLPSKRASTADGD